MLFAVSLLFAKLLITLLIGSPLFDSYLLEFDINDGFALFDLAPQEMISLLDRLISHFPSGEVAFNGYTRFAIWAARHYHGTQSVAGLIRSPGFDDPREPESWNPRLKLVREILLTREPEVAGFPPLLRLFTRLAARSTAISRRGTTVLCYRF